METTDQPIRTIHATEAECWHTGEAREACAVQRCKVTVPKYLIGQSYGNAEIPAGWTPVQANDEHPDRLDDEDAARLAAHELGTTVIPVLYFEGYRPDGTFDDGTFEDHFPGDWAIRWTPEPAEEPGATEGMWHAAIDLVTDLLDDMTEDDRNDAIEALRSRFDEIYTRDAL